LIKVNIMKTRVLSVGCWIPTLAVLMALGMMVAPKSSSVVVDAFILPSSLPTTSTSIATTVITTTRLYETTGNNEQGSQSKKSYKKKSPKKITIADLRKELLKNPQQMEAPQKQKARRTRRRSEQPQQTYTYAAQRKNETPTKKDPLGGDGDEIEESSSSSASTAPGVGSSRRDEFMPLVQARELGLVNAAMQHCDPLVDGAEPRILGRVRVGESGSEEYAYVINKPAGWSIIGSAKSGGGPKQASTSSSTSSDESSSTKPKPKASTKQRIKIKSKSGKGKDEFLEFDEADVLALLTPEERAEWEEQGELEFQGPAYEDDVQDPAAVDIPGWYEVAQMSSEERDEACIEDEDFDPEDIPDFNEADILALMSPEEIEDYEQEKIASKLQQNISKQSGVKSKKNKCNNPLQRYLDMPRDEMDPNMLENLKRIERRLEQQSRKASFSTAARPSVVSWLKELKASEGTPIRGGKFWTAVAGATEVDDSGAVVLCPKAQTENLFVDAAEYVTVVGNGEFLAPPPKRKESTVDIPTDLMEMDIVSKVRKGRDGDTCQTVRVIISETASSCASIIPHVQAQFADGIRGDPAANPFDRRAPRRLIHCQSLTVSSLSYDEDVQAELEDLPDDIAILAERLNRHKYAKGSFLGRSGIRKNPLTNTYREINGAADGFPGWTVDRYADWLFVQHDPKEYRGPLPSIHDGSTTGVYYLSANPDRGSMGSDSSIRPTLLEGKAAPDIVPILENGVTYHVSLDKDLSTGMFLDQRPQRAWLTRNCHEDTHVLNCFAHCGAFSVAAAAAGASTVSLDLNKKWLERVQPQLEANDIVFDERHDCIFGDCFEWLQKLSKRGEKFDIVILDPPSSSVGKKKRRWSVKNDMDELVALAAPLVKEGGLLWTTTNSAGLSPIKFARLCKRGLESVGLENAKLERIQPMPVDFPSIGAQPVKNLVWRIP
jgi:23S rRNA (cytosine1962-C5)-methyltransferase